MSDRIVPNLWFDGCAEEAVAYYLSVFPGARIVAADRYTEVGEEITGKKKGEPLTIEFELLGQRFVAINGGPEFRFTMAVSFMVRCDSQAEIDYYWERLSASPEDEQCGWAKDRYGLTWQIVPRRLEEMLLRGTEAQRAAVTAAFMEMKKFDLARLEEAFASVR